MPSLVEIDSIKIAKKLKRSENHTKLQKYCNISDELKQKKHTKIPEEENCKRKKLNSLI